MTFRNRALLGTAALCFVTPVYAQTATPPQEASQTTPDQTAPDQTSTQGSEDQQGVREIVVTAQRREENLQRVPISVSAFGAEAIQEKGLVDMSRLEGLVPGFTFGRSGVEARPAIRGVRTEAVGVNTDTVIGFFID